MTLDFALVIGAGALALWVYVRVAERGPSRWPMVLGHLALSVVLAYTLVPSLVAALGGVGTAAAGVAAVVGVALPAVAYMFLASLWLLTLLRRLAGQHAR